MRDLMVGRHQRKLTSHIGRRTASSLADLLIGDRRIVLDHLPAAHNIAHKRPRCGKLRYAGFRNAQQAGGITHRQVLRRIHTPHHLVKYSKR